MSQSPESASPQNFRSLAPVAQWSARLALSLPFDHFRRAVLATTTLIRHRYTGFISRDPHTDIVDSFTLTAYPHSRFTTPTPRTCARSALQLARRLGVESVGEDPQHMPGFSRIILGPYKGQRAEGMRTNPTNHTIEELQAHLGSNALVMPGEVFTTRPDGSRTVGHYSEPVGIVLTPTPNKHLVYELADATRQERFTVEDFAATGGLAYMVETQHCPPAPSSPHVLP